MSSEFTVEQLLGAGGVEGLTPTEPKLTEDKLNIPPEVIEGSLVIPRDNEPPNNKPPIVEMPE